MMRIAYISLAILFSILTSTFGQVVKDSLLANELNGMAHIDQKIQEHFLLASTDSAKQAIIQQMQHIFDINCKRIKEVFQQQGYPGWDRVGKVASHNFWLLVQHCDREPTFQQLVLRAMKKQVKRNNADKGAYAYLVDRVRVNQGQKQVYGTQMEVKDILAGYTPKPIENSANVNKRRQHLGLIPLEEYLKQMNKSFFILNKEKIEQERKRRQQNKEH